MRTRQKRALFVVVAILLIATLAGCATNAQLTASASAAQQAASASVAPTQAAEPANDPFGKYAELVTLTTGLKISDKIAKLPNGDTAEDNEYTRYVKERLNIEIKGVWEAPTGDAYNQRVTLTLASGDIPDYIQVFGSYPTFKAYVDSGLIADLKTAYDNFASPDLKEAHESTRGKSLEMATFDGKLYGIPGINKGGDCYNFLWVRQDWLDKLNLKAPSTLDDIVTVAKAFIEQDPDGNQQKDTVGLTGSKTLVGHNNSFHGFDTVFSLYKAYPTHWLKDSAGKVYYGSISAETKNALIKLQEMYQAGYIDKEFGLRKDPNELIVSGKCGMFFGPWWAPYTPLADSVKNDPKADWKALVAPLADDGKLYSHMQGVSKDFIVVSNKCKNPEALVKILNIQKGLDEWTDPKAGTFYGGQGDFLVSRDFIGTSILVTRWDDLERSYTKLKQVVDGSADISTLTPKQKGQADKILADIKEPMKDMGNWSVNGAYMIGGAAAADPKIQQVFGVFYGQTKTMESKWSSLSKLENEAFLKIIMGESIDSFDAFVQQWKELGGDAITAEVQKELDSK